MFGISPQKWGKKHFFRPEKWHGFARCFYSALHTQSILSMAGKSGAVISVPALMMPLLRMAPGPAHRDVGRSAQTQRHPGEQRGRAHR